MFFVTKSFPLIVLLGDTPLPRRPGLGTRGRKIRLATNFFEVTFKDHDIYQYDVTIEPKCPAAINRQIIQELVSVYVKIFQGDKPVFDGKKNLYTIRPLPFGNEKVFRLFACRHNKFFCIIQLGCGLVCNCNSVLTYQDAYHSFSRFKTSWEINQNYICAKLIKYLIV